MSLQTLLVHYVTLIAPGTRTGRYHDVTADWDTATETDTKGWITQTSAAEQEPTRNAQVSQWTLFLSADETITAAYRVRWNTDTFEVAAPPQQAWTTRGEHHLEVQLRLVEG